MSWEPLNRETAAETQALIERTFGLSRETFAASAFCGQGKGAAWTEAQPRERKRILAEILALGIWDALAEYARAEARADEDALVVLRARAEQAGLVAAQRPTLEGREEELKQQDASAAEDVAEAEYELESAQTATTAYALARERRTNAEADARRADAALLAAQDAVSEARASQDKVDAVRAELARLRAGAGDVDELERELTGALTAWEVHREHGRMGLERKRLAADAEGGRMQASEFRARATTVLARIGQATCDRCGQTLGEESARQAAASFRREAEVVEQAVAAVDAEAAALPLEAVAERLKSLDGMRDVPTIRDDLDAARVDAERRQELEIVLAEHKAKALELPRREKEVGAAEQALGEAREALGKTGVIGDQDRLRRRADVARVNLDHRRSLARTALTELERTHQALENARRAEAELLEIARDSAVRQDSLDLLRLAERAYGRDGVPALIVESVAIPQIEAEANTILDELGAACRVELRTQRALKSGDGLKEALDIIVSDEIGERTFETYSGGEKTRIALALRIGLARLLAHRRGAESRLLVIDEPDGLDAEGMDRLPIVLERLSSDFDSILVVSHNPLLATAFPQVISVVRDGNRSRIEMGTAMEAA